MVSYNWDHQHVILRVVAWLQAHGYLVWVDTEQMKGSTVDTMALAVEGSEVMLIGVSRAYKESSNCRMEAQYGLQKKKVLIPLKLTEGYEADGWLGLLLGTSVWYAMYGATLSSESAFEDRMGALSRELGSRGRADAQPTGTEPSAPVGSAAARTALPTRQQQLESMQLGPLISRAVDVGIEAAMLDDAELADDPKAAVLALLLQHEQAAEEEDPAVVALQKLGLGALLRRAHAEGVAQDELDAAVETEEPKAAVVRLLLGA